MRMLLGIGNCAALLLGAVLLSPPAVWAGSCCGGGVATGLILP